MTLIHGSGVCRAGTQIDDVFLSVLGKAAEAVEVFQLHERQRRGGFFAKLLARCQQPRFHAATGVVAASCWRSVPRAATMTTRAAAWSTISSSFEILVAERRKTPPG